MESTDLILSMWGLKGSLSRCKTREETASHCHVLNLVTPISLFMLVVCLGIENAQVSVEHRADAFIYWNLHRNTGISEVSETSINFIPHSHKLSDLLTLVVSEVLQVISQHTVLISLLQTSQPSFCQVHLYVWVRI